MTDTLLRRATPTELSTDARFAGRVRRLAVTAVFALGVIWWLAATTLEIPPIVELALILGWASMPAILLASLDWPLLRYALVLPSTLIGVALLAVSAAWLPSLALAAAGWLLITGGILLGGVLGLWFWYRLLPVPASLDDAFSSGRIALIRVHVAMIVVGVVLASTPLIMAA